MEWLNEIIFDRNFIQAIFVLSVICSLGLALGSIKIGGMSLGVTFVFFAGILAGHLGLEINPDMLLLAQNFGLVIFIYSLGVQVGPGFLSSFKKGGVKLNLLSTAVLIVGTALALLLQKAIGMSLPEMMGLLSGAVTNTPMLGAGQQTLLQIQPEATAQANDMALACAVGYPFGIVGMILSILILKLIFTPKKGHKARNAGVENTFISEFQATNPGICGRSIREIMANAGRHFVISRVWKDGKVIIPTSDTIIEPGEHLLIISRKADVAGIETIFGTKENKDWNRRDIDWNSIDNSGLVSRHILVTKPELNGTKLGSLKLRNTFGINITRVNRAGIDLFASPALRLQFGDKLTIVGESQAIDQVGLILGNEEKDLDIPHIFSIFLGIALGLILGAIPLAIPGMSTPVKLGIAGGPIIIGIFMGAFGTRLHLSTYTTVSANLMLRQLGIVVYLAGLGLSAGANFFETVFRPEGLVWIGLSLVLAIVPVLIVGFVATKFMKVPYGQNVGMLCGAMANPMALNYANSTADGDDASVAYATVYPLGIFLRVITVQIVMTFLL